MSIKDKIAQDMKQAMLAHETERLGALRLIRAEMLKAEKEKGTLVDDERMLSILQTMLKQRKDSIEQFEKAGREDLASKERAEAVIIGQYLPEGLSEEEIAAIIDAVIAETPEPRQMGPLMGKVMGRLKATGKIFDGKAVNALVRGRM